MTPGRSRVGVWSLELQTIADRSATARAAAELERLGIASLWAPGTAAVGWEAYGAMLDATQDLTVASGIVSIWAADPAVTATAVAELDARHPGRFLLGLGVSHAPLVERLRPGQYHAPYSAMVTYLDQLDGFSNASPARRVLAALRPRMLALAGSRSRGAHPFVMPASHTTLARRILGGPPYLAPHVPVTLEKERDAALASARRYLARFLALPNYRASWLELGYTETDLSDGGSERFVTDVVAVGGEAGVENRLREHLDAGADEVLAEIILPDGLPFADWRALRDVIQDLRAAPTG